MQAERTAPKGRDEYHAYLRTPEWRAKREAALDRAEHRCQLCNASKALQVHHRTYERVGNEDPGDLTVLCNGCHEKFHGIDGSKPRQIKTVTRLPSKTPKRGKQTLTKLRAAASLLDPNKMYTVRDLAALTGCPNSAVGTAAVRLAHEGILVKASNKRWRLPASSRPEPFSVRCPSCGSPAGQECPMGGYHMPRWRAAQAA